MKYPVKTKAAKLKNILIYSMNYSPETVGIGRYTGDIAGHLAAAGHEVTVVTAPPHYPRWKVEDGYQNAYSCEQDKRVTVLRCPLLLREAMRGVWRLLAPLSFAATSAPVVFWQILKRRPDVVFCVEPTLFAAPAAQLAAKLVGSNTVLHVHDLEVDAAFAVGHIPASGWLKKLGLAFERAVTLRFDRVITISNRMAEKLANKGVPQGRLAVIRNWVDLSRIFPMQKVSPYRAELGFTGNDFVVLYSGSIGAKQGLDMLLEAAKRLEGESRIHFVIAGMGPAKAGLMERYHHLSNVQFLPFQPYERLNEFLNMADLHVLPQDPCAADLVLPSKLGCLLASGKPLLVTANDRTELAEFLKDAAMVVPPGDAARLDDALRVASRGAPSFSEAAKKECLARLAQNVAIEHLSRIVLDTRRPVPVPLPAYASRS